MRYHSYATHNTVQESVIKLAQDSAPNSETLETMKSNEDIILSKEESYQEDILRVSNIGFEKELSVKEDEGDAFSHEVCLEPKKYFL